MTELLPGTRSRREDCAGRSFSLNPPENIGVRRAHRILTVAPAGPLLIDGAGFHTGPNFRRDRRIRLRLKQTDLIFSLDRGTLAAGWRVEELTARDLARGAELVASLRREVE